MGDQQLANMTVDAIMRRWPSTIPVFIRNGMHCVGCPVGGFHTLADASRAHSLQIEVLLPKVADAIGLCRDQLPFSSG